ncbi:60 kDa SS-A/Ro ribonucleoprotein [Methylosinus sp. sav-2]|uniref:RNA-binding protein n=1 Tax=Methylosinus sp. sav-2 TaxID=2485168 RepID=UPI0004793DB6|nr:RNA-binding protein [Methylosinus sp. sav-2]TDX59581.1 60 kDa SS-A/Ro ribonucleoprotein [Methylosinus sp. sav-2]
MASKILFASIVGKLLPRANARNEAGGPAYARTPRHRLAQLAATGTLNHTFYADAQSQLDDVLLTALDIDPAFVAKAAVYTRHKGHMKDMPALLVAFLSTLQTDDFSKAFRRVIDNGKMLRSFVQIMRSGAVGRKSLGSRPKRHIANWLEDASDIEIMRAAVGRDPSLADVIKMVHPKPKSKERQALYGYLIGKPYDVSALPQIAREFEAFKRNPSQTPPNVPFQMLTALPLTGEHWASIGSKAGWQMLRMNLNTFARHGAFDVPWFPRNAAERLRDRKEIERARVFPYQLMAAYAAADDKVPRMVLEALQDAMEIAVANVPRVKGRVVVCPDVSGSMSSPVTGYRKGATSKVRCIDVAGLVAAAFLRSNRQTLVLPFDFDVVDVRLNARDSVMTNAQKLASIGGGGTNCSAPLRKLVAERADVDLVILVSDNESWVDARQGGRGTATMEMWQELKRRNPDAKLVCIDIQPYATTQAAERDDILNVGGFSDAVFEMISAFAKGELDAEHWVGEIEKLDLG